MAKRQRGARPGQRAPLQRSSQPAAKPAAQPVTPSRPSGSLSDDELARAAELEAEIVAEERSAASSVARGRDRRRATASAAPGSRSGSAGTLAAEDEYRYVMRDLRRIAVVFVGIFSLLLVSWLLIVVLAVVKV